MISFMKVEGVNLGSMAITLQFVIDFKPLKLLQVYEGTWFGHVMSKMCYYATNDEKVFMGLILVNVKELQANL